MSIYEGRYWGEMYDLASDPHKMVILFDSPAYRGVLGELFERLARLMMSQAGRSPFPTGRT